MRRATVLAREHVKDAKLFKCVLSDVCCVFNRGRTGDIKRDRVRAWVSQAIVPENLTRTQDILKMFMQQWSDTQHAVIAKRELGSVFVCVRIAKIHVKFHRWVLLHVLHSHVHLLLSLSAPRVLVLYCGCSPPLISEQPPSNWRRKCRMISPSRGDYVISCGPRLTSWRTDWHAEPRWGD